MGMTGPLCPVLPSPSGTERKIHTGGYAFTSFRSHHFGSAGVDAAEVKQRS